MKKKYSLILSMLLCTVLSGYGQCLSDDFNSGYGNWNETGTYQNTTTGLTGNGTGFNDLGDEIVTNAPLIDLQTLTFWLARGTNSSNKTFSVEYSTTGTGPWTTARDILVGEVITTHQEFTINLNLAGSYYLRLAMTQRTSGSYFLDDIEVTCGASAAEIQLLDSTSNNQNCGFNINYETQVISSNTDLTFDISNLGSADLDITSLEITGDYSVISPITSPFSIPTGNSQTITIRFMPTANGTRNGILTINNNDSDEFNCVVNLTGIGFTPAPEINVEGNLGSFPDISDGDTTPQGTDNTLFSSTIIGTSQTKSYRIQNLGTSDLTITDIITIGGNTGDFIIDPSLTFPLTIAPSSSIVFTIEFSPLTVGTRNTTVNIINNDANENPYNYTIRGTATCSMTDITINPTSGPIGTVTTIIGANFGSITTATINGISASVNVISTTQIEVTIPLEATTGNIIVVNDIGCTSTSVFSVINNLIGGCEGSTVISDLILSEITDATVGGLSYIEIYNGTGATVNLGDYSLGLYNNGSATIDGNVNLNNFNLDNNSTYVVAIGIAASPDYTDPGANSCSITGGNGELANQTNTIGGINKKDFEHDVIRLLKSGGSIIVDEFGVYQDNDWMDSTSITGDRGFNFRRLNTSTQLPDPTFTLTELENWTIIDWVGSGSSSCTTNDYSDIGNFDYSSGLPPSITTQPMPVISNCDLTTSISVLGEEGVSGGNSLAYQWYFLAPTDLDWTPLTNNTTYNNVNTNTLSILNTLNLDGFQYYCQIRENDATCFTASNSVRLTVIKSEWDGTNWSSPPAIDRLVIINGDYDTSTNVNGETSFQACQLVIDANYLLTIASNTFVEVQNNLTVNGNIIVETAGSFVQNNNAAIIDGTVLTDKSKIAVEKFTAILNTYQEYTYWSSPVFGETIADGLNEASTVRRFWFNAQNFRDSTAETDNNNATIAGQDDIDDNANDWTSAPAASTMLPGIGYASTHAAIGFINPAPYKYIFEGVFNNGIIDVPIYRNDAELLDNNWNLIGNPYPSAIDADLFLAANASINQTFGATNGAIYFWSHNTVANGNTNGNEVLNYSQSDYAIINGSGQTMGGDLVMPTRNIPSGQGFFVSMDDGATSTSAGGSVRTTNVIFNNNMRITGNNNQFFKVSNLVDDNKIWLNLTSDNGVFNQILVAYLEGATNDDDGMYYDATKNLSTNANSIIYSWIDNDSNKKFAIQGKAPNSLNIEEIIPIGFYSSIDEATLFAFSIYQLEGEFMNDNTVYLKDNLMNVTHDLSSNDYIFTSETGEFNNRFEIVFQPETLSINQNEISFNDLTITELSDGSVKISVENSLTIKHVKIIDLLGRIVYDLKGNSNIETYDLSRLSQSAYTAKVKLSNGQIITKKAVKTK